MSEFRLNPATQEWVIIAGERAGRPDDYPPEESDSAPILEWDAECPFCPGNEEMTPPEIYRDTRTLGGGEGRDPWRVRIVPNKFPAVGETLEADGRGRGVYFTREAGAGVHDVVIETPVHNRFTPLLSREELRRVLEAYRWRYLRLREDPRIKLITLFKNHGRAAGTSLIHPHSQIIATPIVPVFLRRRLDDAVRRTGEKSVYREMLEEELADGRRMLIQTDYFAAFCPFASKSPYEVWILPLRDCPSFGAVTPEELDDLAGVMGRLLFALWKGLNHPAFNYVIRTAPVPEETGGHYLWHVEMAPRVTTAAGFEIGSGISINVGVPEENAALLRNMLDSTATGG